MDAVPLRAARGGQLAVCPSCLRPSAVVAGGGWTCPCGASGSAHELVGCVEGGERDPAIAAVLSEAAAWFSARLFAPEGAWVRAYLASRGVSRDVAREFGLGWSPRGLDLVTALCGMGRSVPDLVVAGLLERAGGMYRPRFRGRVMFPVRARDGSVLGFAGRTLDGSAAKWVNSPGAVLPKSRTLYGLDRLPEGSGPVLLVEGYLDVVVLQARGWPALGTMGTSLAGAQADLLAGLGREVVVLFDGDSPGRKAAARAAALLEGRGVAVRVGTLPEGSDPDELALAGRLAGVVESAVPGWEFRARQGMEGVEAHEAASVLASLVAEARDPRERDLRLARAQEMLAAVC
ncbi:MAG: toprim domain-containing protein [Bacillota bacterium]|nr:toprim domain-containing protein [Bacillota bacterium]